MAEPESWGTAQNPWQLISREVDPYGRMVETAAMSTGSGLLVRSLIWNNAEVSQALTFVPNQSAPTELRDAAGALIGRQFAPR